ncbi:predicted protein [Aspergillus terreus NIH2624]|uniref:Integrase catalytic domain-containing protein n=1 Tax=Aspergillus terreus (strain NIH 2624 / FGSC A1156) TaxID=341663 RepID=Q0CWP1_ASPTN|nr:uncharacterized protein ATEG_01893 [Aspergillus terreus NIH2624]EAU36855.1 predicted protein [Aspergillus terreus NIH2624]
MTDRISTILSTSSDWLLWFRSIKTLALNKGVWGYINPDQPEEPILPERPAYPFPSRIQGEATSILDLSPANRELYRDLLREYELQMREFDHVNKGLTLIHMIIQNSISQQNKRAIINTNSAYQSLRILRDKLAPTNEARKRDVIGRYHQLRAQGSSVRSPNLESYISQWENLYSEAQELDISEVNPPIRALYDFLEAIHTVQPYFSTLWHDKLIEKSERNEPIPTFYEVTKRFRDHIKLSPKRNSHMANIANATFMGQSDNPNARPRIPRNRPRKCPCQSEPNDGFHDFSECLYTNQSKRPIGWSPDPEAQKRFERANQNPGFKRAYENALQKFKTSQTTNLTVTMATVALATAQTTDSRSDWAFDTASNTHVCNDLSAFKDYTPRESKVLIGDTHAEILGFGTVLMKPSNCYGKQTTFELKDCAYVPKFHINILSAMKAKKAGIFYNSRVPCLEGLDGSKVCQIYETGGISLVRWGEYSLSAHFTMGNPYKSESFGQNDLPDRFSTLELEDSRKQTNQTSQTYQIQRSDQPIISKGSIELWHQRLGHPGIKALKHLEQATSGAELTNQSEELGPCETCLVSKSKRQISRRPIGRGDQPFETIHWDLIHMKRGMRNMNYISHIYDPMTHFHMAQTLQTKEQVSRSLNSMILLVKNQYRVSPKRVHSDNDLNLSEFIDQSEGLIFNTSPPDQPEQNPFSERSGGLIIMKSRLILVDSGIPMFLWPEVVSAATHILNRTPIRALDWKTPYEALYTALPEKPGYMTSKPDISNLKRFGCRAYTRIINIPRLSELDPDLGLEVKALTDSEINDLINSIEAESDESENAEMSLDLDDSRTLEDSADVLEPLENQEKEENEEYLEDSIGQDDIVLGDLPDSPPQSPVPPAPDVVIDNSQFKFDDYDDIMKPLGLKRQRSPSPDPEPSKIPRNYAILQAFSTDLGHKKLHKNDLPPPPANWREAVNSPFRDDWIRAAEVEYQQLTNMDTWTPVSIDSIGPDQRALPLKWVFTYKFDQSGFLSKFKARICVRGDLQPISDLDTRAITLGSRTLRVVLALVAAFDLEAVQLDAVNAFLNSQLDETVYVSPPPGLGPKNRVFKLKKALYGLRRAPFLWQREIGETLKRLGLDPIPEDPCVYVNEFMILVIYGKGRKSETSPLFDLSDQGSRRNDAISEYENSSKKVEKEALDLAEGLYRKDRSPLSPDQSEASKNTAPGRKSSEGQTVDLLIKQDSAYKSKLKHVDIHRHWLRQEVQNGSIQIQWVPTNQMIADGLTKRLTYQKHQEFMKHLNMEDISELSP